MPAEDPASKLLERQPPTATKYCSKHSKDARATAHPKWKYRRNYARTAKTPPAQRCGVIPLARIISAFPGHWPPRNRTLFRRLFCSPSGSFGVAPCGNALIWRPARLGALNTRKTAPLDKSERTTINPHHWHPLTSNPRANLSIEPLLLVLNNLHHITQSNNTKNRRFPPTSIHIMGFREAIRPPRITPSPNFRPEHQPATPRRISNPVRHFWQTGQKCVPRPARKIRRIGVPHTRHGSPVRR